MSLDTAGPLARNVRDLALFLDVMAGFDPDDPNSALAQPSRSYTDSLDRGLENLRIGSVKTYAFKDLASSVEAAVRAAVDTFSEGGAEITEINVAVLEGHLIIRNFSMRFCYINSTGLLETNSDRERMLSVHLARSQHPTSQMAQP